MTKTPNPLSNNESVKRETPKMDFGARVCDCNTNAVRTVKRLPNGDLECPRCGGIVNKEGV